MIFDGCILCNIALAYSVFINKKYLKEEHAGKNYSHMPQSFALCFLLYAVKPQFDLRNNIFLKVMLSTDL